MSSPSPPFVYIHLSIINIYHHHAVYLRGMLLRRTGALLMPTLQDFKVAVAHRFPSLFDLLHLPSWVVPVTRPWHSGPALPGNLPCPIYLDSSLDTSQIQIGIQIDWRLSLCDWWWGNCGGNGKIGAIWYLFSGFFLVWVFWKRRLEGRRGSETSDR